MKKSTQITDPKRLAIRASPGVNDADHLGQWKTIYLRSTPNEREDTILFMLKYIEVKKRSRLLARLYMFLWRG